MEKPLQSLRWTSAHAAALPLWLGKDAFVWTRFGAQSGNPTALKSVAGQFDGSSPLRAATRQISEGNLDLTRQIAHEQSRLAFGAGRTCTKAFQMKKTTPRMSSRTAQPSP
jgi:hypothetical protein